MKRYARQILLPEIGSLGQDNLTDTKVLIVGIGGLGTLISQYLAMAGIGTIGLMDFDKVSWSNLNRQMLFTESDISSSKVKAAKDALLKVNSTLNYITFEDFLTAENAISIFRNFDIIVDGTDNISSKYIIDDACYALNIPWVYGSIFKFQGQISVFNYKNGPTYRCLYPKPNPNVQSCEEAGVIGIISGTIALKQATEIIKISLNLPGVLTGTLLLCDILSHQNHFFSLNKNRKSINSNLTVLNQNTFILDVREPHELPKIDSKNVKYFTINELDGNVEEIPKSEPVFVVCQSGLRSQLAINHLRQKYEFNNLHNLEGGIFNLRII